MPFVFNLPVVDMILGVGLVVAFLSRIRQKRSLALPQNLFILFFLALVFLSNMAHGNLDAAFEQFIFYLKRAVPFLIFLFFIDSPQKLKSTIGFILILTTYLAIQSIYQSAHGVGWAGQAIMETDTEIENVRRVLWVGMWDGPNVLSLLFVLAIPFALEFALGPYGFLSRAINLVVVCVLSYATILANSRGSFIALAGAVLAYFAIRFRSKRGIVMGVAITMLVWTYLAPSRLSVLTIQESSAHEHTWLWEQGMTMLRSNPILGVGKGQFQAISGGLQDRTHNNFVQNMAEMGLVGFFVYVSIIYLSFKGLLTVQRTLKDRGQETLLMSLSKALFASLVGYNIATYFVTMELDILFVWWALCAVVVTIARERLGPFPIRFSFRDAANVGMGMFVIVFSVYLLAFKEIL